MASIKKRPDGKWRARYRDPDGREHARHFERRVDAQTWLDGVTSTMVRGDYVDPNAGRVLLRDFAAAWMASQTSNESTREQIESRLRVHILPAFGDLELRAIRPSMVQTWVRSRQEGYAPQYVRVVLGTLSAVLSAAVDDGLIAKNPCSSRAVKAPAIGESKVVPWSGEMVDAVIAAHPARYRAIPLLAAGCGLRQGEALGVRVEDVDFLRRKLHVRQQVKIVRAKVVIAPPKGGKVREVPLPDVVASGLAEQLRTFPPGPGGLISTTRLTTPIRRTYYNSWIWKPALEAAGVPTTPGNGTHALRHHYARVLLEAGVSIRALGGPPRPLRPGLHASDLHPPDAQQRGPLPPRSGRRLPGSCGLSAD